MPQQPTQILQGRDAAVPYHPPGRQQVKLRHLARHRALLCVQCGYCVLPRALDRHLKTLHHLPASERKPHLDTLQDLDLADLDEIVYPSPGSEPVPGLLVYDGYKCEVAGCEHLSVTNKRMQAHWRTGHPGTKELRCRRVKLQTFFRGNSLRYFIVASPRAAVSEYAVEKVASRKDSPLEWNMNTASDTVLGIDSSPSGAHLALTKSDIVFQLPTPASTTPTDALMIFQPQIHDGTIETSMQWLLTQRFADESFVRVQPVVSSAPSWRNEMLQSCFEADFLKFAVLSLTSHYIAYNYPDSRELYSQEAEKYRDLAIRTLASHVTEVTSENFFTVFNFTRLMTLCCLAGVQLNKLQGRYSTTAKQDMLPEWFPVQFEGRKLIWPHRGDGRIISAMHGPWQPMATSNAMPEYDLDNNPFDGKLSELASALKILPSEIVDISCLEALNILRRVWATPYRDQGNSFRDVALMWAVRIGQRYLDLVESHDPVALIVFAHYWVLWSQSEGIYWYMKGHAETMMTKIVQKIDPQWLEWIDWPISMVLGPDSLDSS